MVVEPKKQKSQCELIALRQYVCVSGVDGSQRTFGSIHPSDGIKCPYCGLSRFGSWALKHGTALRQKMVLHGFHQQFLAFQIVREHFVVFQVSNKLQFKNQGGKK